jgi:tRNA(His) guanylyltransferase
MDFDTLDKQMRSFEQSLDRCMLQGAYVVARLDGHGFTRLTKKEWNLEKPFDVRFRDYMITTLRRLMDCGFRIIYGYSQSDEISLLFHLEDSTFGRKERKLLSILASEASVTFSMASGRHAVFDCRLIPLPNGQYVIDYFRWRQEDAHRNSLNGYCYWLLRADGLSAAEAQQRIGGISNAQKNELLYSHDINYNDLPSWQKRGVGMYYTEVQKEGFNPVTGQTVSCLRRELNLEEDLPVGTAYTTFLSRLLSEHNPKQKK